MNRPITPEQVAFDLRQEKKIMLREILQKFRTLEDLFSTDVSSDRFYMGSEVMLKAAKRIVMDKFKELDDEDDKHWQEKRTG